MEEQDLGTMGSVAAGCQGWESGPGKDMTSKASNTRTATITPYPLLSLFYTSNWLNITCIFFDYLIWHNSIPQIIMTLLWSQFLLTCVFQSQRQMNTSQIWGFCSQFFCSVILIHSLSLDSKQHNSFPCKEPAFNESQTWFILLMLKELWMHLMSL